MIYDQDKEYTTADLKTAIAECEWLKDHAIRETKIAVLVHVLTRQDMFSAERMGTDQWKESLRQLIIDFCVWLDRNGCYTDEDRTYECGAPMSLNEACGAMILHLDDSQL